MSYVQVPGGWMPAELAGNGKPTNLREALDALVAPLQEPKTFRERLKRLAEEHPFPQKGGTQDQKTIVPSVIVNMQPVAEALERSFRELLSLQASPQVNLQQDLTPIANAMRETMQANTAAMQQMADMFRRLVAAMIAPREVVTDPNGRKYVQPMADWTSKIETGEGGK